jgi:phytoene dehydrogenase-like protein/ferredoxin-NADP reductase
MTDIEEADVVVIGSGMGGLAAARAIAQFGGRRVLVLEQHYTIGGMTHEFSRAGQYHFGTGLHYMSANAGPFLEFMTDGRAQLAPLPDDYDVLHFPEFDFSVPATWERFRARLVEQFPDETAAIDAFFRTIRRAMIGLAARNVLASFPAAVRGGGTPLVRALFPAAYRSVSDQVSRSFRDPRLRAIFAARWGLYGTPPRSSAFGYHAAVPLTFFMDGTAHPVGGPAELGRIIVEILHRYGVQLRPRQRVVEVLVERNRVTGVDVQDTANGRRYRVRTGTVVSASGVRNTYALSRQSRRLTDLPRELSALMLFIGLKRSPAAFGLGGENHWLMPNLDGDDTLYVSFPSLNNPAAHHHTMEALELVDPEVVEQWRGTAADTRPESYQEFKQELEERLVARLEQQWPGLRDEIAFTELATPLSFETYQNSVRGSFYGLAATPQRLRSSAAGCRTPVKGLFVAGQDAWGSGVVGALAGGLMAANAVLKPRQLGQLWGAIRKGPPARDPATAWQGYLRVSAIETLTATVRRFRLEALDSGPLPFTFTAGQYLKVELPVAVEPVERSYSICTGPQQTAFLDIAVRREPDGLGSVFLHQEVTAGQALRVSGPYGEFTWEGGPETETLLLIGGGVGITPLMSVLAAAADAGHRGRIVLLASFRAENEVLFGPELAALRHRLPGLVVKFVVTEWYGRVGAAELMPYVDGLTRVHLCGPAPMMQDLIGVLTSMHVPRDAIHTEAFVSGSGGRTRRERAHAVALAAAASGVTTYPIALADGRSAFSCRPGQTVLDAANAAGVPLPQSCGEGSCGTCRVRVLGGTFETDSRGMFSAAELSAGWLLACQTLPTSELTISTEAFQ